MSAQNKNKIPMQRKKMAKKTSMKADSARHIKLIRFGTSTNADNKIRQQQSDNYQCFVLRTECIYIETACGGGVRHGNSVGTVSDYELDAGVQSPAGQKTFLLASASRLALRPSFLSNGYHGSLLRG
ncbi:hypothetical protein L798_10242 [Zootermopsis nevadensis]|uniref:Uncharacterized protein n=1 Tax=Zootermopsis nevadensis TaxID=136037 RepID=A0A067QZ57_ZOONE|nr:hypothetical protein L798_10242 [Zootermopsis nevadensis]